MGPLTIFAAVVLAAAGTILTGSPASAAPCRNLCLVPGDTEAVITFGLVPRRFKVHVPASYRGDQAVPLLLDLHGFSSSAEEERDGSGQLQESDKRGFIAVWPQGMGLSWNGYGCCAVAYDVKIDDVGFLRQVIATLKSRANIDDRRVFITGISNGAGMSQRMACEAADVVTSVAPVSFPLNTDKCRPSRPITVVEIAGTADTTIPDDGSTPPANLPPDTLGAALGVQGARQSLAAWKLIDGCSDDLTRTPLPAGSRNETYRSCQGGTKVGLVTLAGAGHIPYNGTKYRPGSGNASIDVASYIWDTIFTN